MVARLYYLVILLGLTGCHQQSNQAIKNEPNVNTDYVFASILNQWPKGTFVYESNAGVYTEIWERADQELRGQGNFVIHGDTLFSMKMNLVEVNNYIKMFYQVNRQNDGKETEFALTNHTNNRFTFENPFRNFPSIMTYELLGDSAIHITERGFKDKKEETQDFVVKRKP